MAQRFWVATRDGDWGSSSNWSTSSGGSGGASVPSFSDTATIDGAGGRNGGIRLQQNTTAANITISDNYRGVFNLNGKVVLVTGSLSVGKNVVLIGLSNAQFLGSNLLISGNPSALRNLQAHWGTFTMNGTTVKVNHSYMKNVAGVGATKKALNCYDQGGNTGWTFEDEVSLATPVQLLGLNNEGDWPSPLEYLNLSGDRCDYLNPDQFRMTVNGQILNFRDTSTFKLLDFSVTYDGKELRFSEIASPTFANASFALDHYVSLEMDLGYGLENFFRGRIRKRSHVGVNHSEEVEYSVVGLQAIADEVDFTGRDGMPGDVYPGYMLTAGQIVNNLFLSNMTALESHGVISTIGDPGSIYLDTVVKENLNLEGSGFTSAIRQVIKDNPTRKFFWDDVTGTWIFPDITAAQPYDLDIDLSGLDECVYTLDISNRYTAIECYAPYSTTAVTSQRAFTELQPSWDIDFEADWTIRKALGMDGADKFGDSYAWVFRRWTFQGQTGNSTQRYKPARMYCLIPWWQETAWVPIDCMIDWQNQVVVSKVPIVVKGNPHVPGDSVGPYAAMLSYWDPITYPVSALAALRVPAEGFEGTAYEKFNITKTKKVLVDVLQLYDSYAQDMLNVLKDVIVTADIPIQGDPIREFINLNAKLRVLDSRQLTGMEEFYGMVVSYRYTFGRPGMNTISITTDKSIVSKAR